MQTRKINQLSTELSPAGTDLLPIGDPVTGVLKKVAVSDLSSLFGGGALGPQESITLTSEGQEVLITNFKHPLSEGFNLWAGGGGLLTTATTGNGYQGSKHSAFGYEALLNTTNNEGNSAFGYYSLRAGGDGGYNTGVGVWSLKSCTGGQNVAVGTDALGVLVNGWDNVAIGHYAGYSTNGYANVVDNSSCIYIGASCTSYANNSQYEVVIGKNAQGRGSQTMTLGNGSQLGVYINGGNLYLSQTSPVVNVLCSVKTVFGSVGKNMFFGNGGQLQNSADCAYNTSFGVDSLLNVLNGAGNTTIGFESGKAITSSYDSTAIGKNSLKAVTTGWSNVAVGANAGSIVTTGENNVFVGGSAGTTAGQTAVGNSVYIGYNSNPSANSVTNEIAIGYNSTGNGSNTITLGNSSTKVFWYGGANIQGDIILDATFGSKFGTATTQKLAFWNATPIVQPTTSVAAATFTANSGTAVNDASTFDGYTIGKVVKALRNTGLLA